MDTPFIIPLAVFAMVVLIVAIVSMVKVRDKELEVHHSLRREEMEHQLKMRELDGELTRLRAGSS